jgi:CheY-like chemotaxis protein
MTPRRILVVDDVEDTATSLAFLLNALGHEVKFATDPRSAIDMAPTFRPEIAFFDIGMPDYDGWRLCRLFRDVLGLQETRYFAISGYAKPSDRQRSLEAGFDGHFAKPLDFRVIENLLASLDKSPTKEKGPSRS